MAISVKKIIVLAIIVSAVLLAVQGVVVGTPVSSVPSWIQPYWQVLTIAFTAAPAVLVFGLLRNITGYLNNKYHDDPDAQYEGKQIAATLARFTLYVPSALAVFQTLLQGTQYQTFAVELAGGVSIFIDIVVRAYQSAPQPTTTISTTTTPNEPDIITTTSTTTTTPANAIPST